MPRTTKTLFMTPAEEERVKMKDDHRVRIRTDGELICPSCGGDNLHQVRVEVFEREEDKQTGVHADVVRDSVHIDTEMAGNPSKRRQGTKISFTCEGCDEAMILSIEQHKGTTYLHFDIEPK
jgi:hypothetical protein